MKGSAGRRALLLLRFSTVRRNSKCYSDELFVVGSTWIYHADVHLLNKYLRDISSVVWHPWGGLSSYHP